MKTGCLFITAYSASSDKVLGLYIKCLVQIFFFKGKANCSWSSLLRTKETPGLSVIAASSHSLQVFFLSRWETAKGNGEVVSRRLSAG